MNPDLLQILRCPESRQTLIPASPEVLAKVNGSITNGLCRNQSGVSVTEILQTALVREDGQILYPVRNSIPVLLPDEGIRFEAA